IDPPQRRAEQLARLSQLQAEVSKLAATELPSIWLEQLSLASRYLLASRSASNVDQAADEFGLNAARLEQWSKALSAKSLKSPDHPLHAWSQLADGEKLAEATHKEKAAASAEPFIDFRRSDYQGWFATGDAFATRPAQFGELIVGTSHDRP